MSKMKQWIQNQSASLVVKSLIFMCLLSVSVMVLAGYFFIMKERDSTLKKYEKNYMVLQNITIEALGLPLWNFDEVQAQSIVDALREVEGFCGARVRDSDGNVMANIDTDLLRMHDVGSVRDTQRGMLSIVTSAVVFIDPASDTKDNAIPVGTLTICHDFTPVWNAIYARETMLFVIAALVVMGVIVIGWVSFGFITKPLAKLAVVMRDTKYGLTEITDRELLANNEVGALGNQFNVMVAELAQAQVILEGKIEEAQSANRAKSLFLSSISHELRTPMHAILNYSEMGAAQLEKQSFARVEKYLTNIHSAAKRLLTLINGLLDLSKLEAGKMQLAAALTSVDSIITESQQELGALFEKKHIEFILHNFSGISIISCDKARMVQVCINVLSNALKYSPEYSEIEVKVDAVTWQNQPMLQISFINAGPAIPTEDIERIFTLFTQSSSPHNASGTGLGLAICREIMYAHDGHIWSENLSDARVAFHMVLPIANT